MNTVSNLSANMGMSVPLDTYLVAEAAQLDVLRHGSASGRMPAIRLRDLPIGAAVPEDVVSAARVMVVEVNPAIPASLSRIAQLRKQRPDLPLIVAIESADLGLVRTMLRQGVHDVVTLPFDADELTSTILEASAREVFNEHALAPMIGVVGALGGIGSTTVLTHLAAAIGDRMTGDKGCCLIDLDFQFGGVSHYFGKQASTSVVDLLEAAGRLDEDMVRDAAVDSGLGTSFLGAPEAMNPLETVDVDRLLRLITLARKQFGFVLLDLPSNWTNWSLSAACACSEIIVLTDQSLKGLRQAKRCLAMFDAADIPVAQQGVAVNRVEKKLFQPIKCDDVQDTLRREVIATFGLDRSDLANAQDQGALVWNVNSRSSFGKDVAALADHLTGKYQRAQS